MQHPDQLSATLNDLFTQNRIEEYFNTLQPAIFPSDTHEDTTWTLLRREWTAQQQAEQRGDAPTAKEQNNLMFRLCQFGNEVVQKRRAEIFMEKICVVCFDEAGKAAMGKYFNPRYFNPENIRYHCFSERKEADLVAAAKSTFVLFDNYHVPADGDTSYQRDLLTDYLNADEARYVLSFGSWVFDSKEMHGWADKFYAANSPISLYARIRELREYLKMMP
jgi:hypothetical protein